jgi:hypothetical protein
MDRTDSWQDLSALRLYKASSPQFKTASCESPAHLLSTAHHLRLHLQHHQILSRVPYLQRTIDSQVDYGQCLVTERLDWIICE